MIPCNAKTLQLQSPLFLENGEVLENVAIAFNTYGTLNAAKSNVVWVCHALTANSDVLDWWHGLFGVNRLFDPSKYFIVCANILGSCYGSTGAHSIDKKTGKKYGKNFPLLTVRDIVHAHIELRKHLQIETINVLIGGSLGGQQCLEWAIMEPEEIRNLIPIATNAQHSPWGIAWNTAQRMALECDNSFNSESDEQPKSGLSTARAIAMLSYRSYDTFYETQNDSQEVLENFKADSYQRYQGEKLVRRFDAYSYYTLTKIMDSHNVGRKRGGVDYALQQIKANTCVIGIDSDMLFPIREQKFLAKGIPDAELYTMQSLYGHDGFLLEYDQLSMIIKKYLEKNYCE